MSLLVPHLPENAPFTGPQRQWLNGYLAGLYSRQPFEPGALPGAEAPAPATAITVLFGTQTGTCEGLAREAAERLEHAGCQPTVLGMDEIEASDLPAQSHILCICSTYGDGEMPDAAQALWDSLTAEDAPRLEQTKFSVLALGDTSYETFCSAGADLDRRLEELGATRLYDRIDCDVDFEDPFEVWMAGVIEQIGEAGVASVTGVAPKPASGKPAWSKKNPFSASLIENRRVNSEESSKEIRHYVIDLGDSGLVYDAGDAVQVMPINDTKLVDELLSVLGFVGDEVLGDDTIGEALQVRYEIRTPGRDLIAALVEAGGDLSVLQNEEARFGFDIVDCLALAPDHGFTPAAFLALLRPLQARAYSISSSQSKFPNQIHLTVASVRHASNGRPKEGVCSCFLADRADRPTPVRIWMTPNTSFCVPTDPAASMIMVGPGTGIAPFLGFLQEREVRKAPGKNWLFFGERNEATDFLYQNNLEEWLEHRLLTRLDLAFSRDQDEKIYVQNRMTEHGAELFKWLEEGAYFYVCGDAYRMAKDVERALHDVIATHGSLGETETAAYIARLKKEKRYVRDVY